MPNCQGVNESSMAENEAITKNGKEETLPNNCRRSSCCYSGGNPWRDQSGRQSRPDMDRTSTNQQKTAVGTRLTHQGTGKQYMRILQVTASLFLVVCVVYCLLWSSATQPVILQTPSNHAHQACLFRFPKHPIPQRPQYNS